MAFSANILGSVTRLLKTSQRVSPAPPCTQSTLLRARPRGAPGLRFVPIERSGMAGRAFVTSATSGSNLVEQIEKKNATTPVIVYSKTYCPYCAQVKGLFKEIGVTSAVIELDDLADGAEVQSALGEITKRSTVPQVFIGGKFVGGCDDTMAAYKSGKLQSLLKEAGVTSSL
eukprot:jgi/Botrbrau1/10491/Bobra.0133s0094.1